MTLRVLLLCDDRPTHAATLLDHIRALSMDSRHTVFKLNSRNWPYEHCIDFDVFDVVVIHYSIAIIYETYLPEVVREKLRAFEGLKVLFIQDEYRQVSTYIDAMLDLGVGMVFTSVPEMNIPGIYGRLLAKGVRMVPTLTGYADSKLAARPVRALAARPLDVIYRGRPCPFELGHLAREKVTIAERFNEHAGRLARPGLKCDIDWREQARIYGDGWVDFMSSGRACLGTESGASIVDHDGSLQAAVEVYRDEHRNATYEEVHANFLSAHEGNLLINTISPRAFEAICLRTVLILHPGEYSKVLQPWIHYIPLAKDFSNFEEVAGLLHDTGYLEAMADRAYRDIILNGTWLTSHFTVEVDDTIEDEYRTHEFRRLVRRRDRQDIDAWRQSLEQAVAALGQMAPEPVVMNLAPSIESGIAPLPVDQATPAGNNRRDRPMALTLVLPGKFARLLRELRRMFWFRT